MQDLINHKVQIINESDDDNEVARNVRYIKAALRNASVQELWAMLLHAEDQNLIHEISAELDARENRRSDKWGKKN